MLLRQAVQVLHTEVLREVFSLQDQKSPVVRRVPPDRHEEKLVLGTKSLQSSLQKLGAVVVFGEELARELRVHHADLVVQEPVLVGVAEIVLQKFPAVPEMLVQKHLRVRLLERQHFQRLRSKEPTRSLQKEARTAASLAELSASDPSPGADSSTFSEFSRLDPPRRPPCNREEHCGRGISNT